MSETPGSAGGRGSRLYLIFSGAGFMRKENWQLHGVEELQLLVSQALQPRCGSGTRCQQNTKRQT